MAAAHDQTRNLSNLIRLGTVAEVDLAAAACRVQTGELVTAFLPWLVAAAGDTISWSAPSVGEQVTVLCPEGDTTNALVLRGLYSDQFPAPANSDAVHLLRFADGAELRYDSGSHTLSGTLPSGGTIDLVADGGMTITAAAGVTIKGPLTVDGDVAITGTATADSDVVGGGISLKGHKHTGVTAGSAVTGSPQ